MIKNIVLGVGVLALFACSAAPEAGSPGSCSLSCGGAKPGITAFTVTPLFDETTVAVACLGNFAAAKSRTLPLNGPLTARFRVTTSVPVLGGSSGTGSTTTSALAATDVEDLPRGGVAFEPVLSGLLDVANTNPENLSADGTKVTPFKYAGVVTPKSEWCSDTCGIITYEFWPDCVENTTNVITASVLAGNATIDGSYKFNVSNSATTTSTNQ